MEEMDFDSNVFINCPFDKEYQSLLKVLLFTIVHCGFTPRIALEKLDSSESRLEKIQRLIKQSKYSIHDISRCKSKKKNEYYRLNMPFEIGLDFGCKEYGDSQNQEKELLILAGEPYQYQKAISDLSGIDVKYHNCTEETLCSEVRNWFYTRNKNIKTGTQIWDDYNAFTAYLYSDYKEKDVINMPVPEFVDKSKEYISSL